VAEHFDVIIVGARCAGSPLATLLARAGLRVCVVDRATFPSETPSTHGIQPCGVKILDHLGVLEPLLEVTPAIDRGTVFADGVRAEVDGVVERVGAPMVIPRRQTLDVMLVEAAAKAGAEIRTGTAVTGLLEDRRRVVGVRTPAGPLRAPLVVGADGARSTVARLAGAAEYHRTRPGRVFVWGYYEGVPASNNGVWLGKSGETAFIAGPTDHGLFLAAVGATIERRDELRADRAAGYATLLRTWPELHASLGDGRRVGPVRMMSRWHGFFRESAGPGWVLVGDGGHFKDPTPGQGISDALRQVTELAPAIERALGGAADPDRALREWWAWRDRDAWEMYWFARDMGAPGRTRPLERAVFQRIAADPALTDGLMRVLNHDVPPSSVFTPALALGTGALALLAGEEPRGQLLRNARALVGNELRRRARRRELPVAA
jgi:2-polyprenyl-6-methoxyphenol hydroxylase-like FAD-dependent oxidoreductase